MNRVVPVILLAACGGSSGKGKSTETAVQHHGHIDHVEDSGGDDGVEVESTRGRIDPAEAEDALAPHQEALTSCYLSQVGTRKWLGGHVELHWEVDGDGGITSATISSSDLGAWPIEQCMLGEAAAVAFPEPHGGKPADVTVPLDFDPPRPAAVWEEDMTNAEVGKHLKDLTVCAKDVTDPTDVTITFYVGTRGKVQSVGFAAPVVIDPAWAGCVEKKVGAWMLTDPKGQVVKAAFVYRPGETPAKPDDDEDDEDL